MDRENLFKAKTTVKNDGMAFNNIWIEGDLIKSGVKYYIHPRSNKVSVEGELGKIIVMHEVQEDTICHCSGKEYMDSDIAWEGDIFESQVSGDLMVLRYGTYQAFCPVDQQFMDSVGFYAECKGLPDMPIGDLKDYALKKGNIFDNPELLEVLS